jgi:hypothetical protein
VKHKMRRLAAAVAAHSARPDACAITALALAALDHACLAEERPLPYRMRKGVFLVLRFLCLSRACLGKSSVLVVIIYLV